MSALILGATGLCGGSFLRNAIASDKFTEVFTITRRELPSDADNVKQIVETDSSKWAQLFPETGVKFYFSAFGTTRAAAGSAENFYKIDHDLNVELAKAAKTKGCTTMVLVSSVGANENSMLPYFKDKGEIERDILALDFDHTIILRPGPLLGRQKSKGFLDGITCKLSSAIYGTPLQSLFSHPVYGEDVGKVGVDLALQSAALGAKSEKVRIVTSSEIRDIASKI
ncbi:hypothetical protein ZYGR_0N04030 [Zygosaccharomyces rouxii]|uniref:Protein FMP52, mitochondrial n=2 Tax=Zygosaccharomyces rouxii TaxID=4956 RepID=C5DVU7_ZYGRC|nr:uncharacterized protein ZYRO0D09548g [Zygosaccharomyces rouxii]KAH9200826.1 hypothetical protein LQ764DRAFT_100537 [Zygosaccharomyces rouxii]GAV48998.1 hypothetical protein ZYGR_0N04030 [Zygosaccharomyces rouxii]CAR27916.1 ZYRO0D09548p [Zygosaccharomyces rouxii]